MATLYRKYRPQNFTEVVGQNQIKIILQHEIETGKLAHAYLFCGPRAVGKTTLARVFAKAVNCLRRKEGDFEPCNKCDSCLEITAGKSLDIIEIDAASHTGVDNVRENIIASARVSPSKLKMKVFIIDEVHMLSLSAFNALLKILEEPPEQVMFILCTTEIHKVPTTIISRCQRFDFKRISLADTVKKLNYIVKKEGIKINKSILEAVARHSAGHMRDAESLLGQIVTIGGKEITQEEADLVIPRSDWKEIINLIEMLGKKDSAGAIRLVNNLVDEGIDLKVFLNDLIEVFRKILLAKINPSLSVKLGLELGESLEIKLTELSNVLSLEFILAMIDHFIKASGEIKSSFITQLPLEIAITKLCSGGRLPPPDLNPGRQDNSSRRSGSAPVGNRQGSVEQEISSTFNSGNLNYDQVIAKWNELLLRVKKYNHSLSFILRVCQPKSIKGNQLCLAFRYKFHKDRVNDPGIRALIEKVLKEVYNIPLIVEAVIDEGLEVEGGAFGQSEQSNPAEAEITGKKEDEGMIDNLLKTFGGKIVQ